MLFFRSEETVRDWCVAEGHEPGPTVTIGQLWGLARAWYSGRLDPGARRPTPEEIPGIFADLGLVGDFWDPLAGA